MNKQLNQLLEFHKAFDSAFEIKPKRLTDKPTIQLRENLMQEELEELLHAMWEEDLDGIAKELIDLLYVTFGTAIAYGLQDKLVELFDEVHRSNMSKLGEDGKPIRREDGKALKGPNYTKADIKSILAA